MTAPTVIEHPASFSESGHTIRKPEIENLPMESIHFNAEKNAITCSRELAMGLKSRFVEFEI
jgi:hypothetical protein